MKKKQTARKSFNEIPAYRNFVNQRDLALERILHNTRLRVADHLNGAFCAMIDIVKREYKQLSALYHPMPHKPRFSIFEKKLNDILEAFAVQIACDIFDQRKKAYLLAHAGEAQAVAQVQGKKPNYDGTKYSMDQWVYSEPFANGLHVMKSVDLFFSKLRRMVMNELETATALDEPVEKAIGRIIKKLPKRHPMDKARKLKKVPKKVPVETKEAAKPIDMQFLDDETWQDIVDDYKEDYIPVNRSPDEVFDAIDPATDEPIPAKYSDETEQQYYGWEVERDTTHDFVQQVRDGQIDAANSNGITDFVVIAILDKTTCETCCGDVGCYDFNGMTTKEISDLTKGEYDTPPYHFNCRCTVAPYTEDLPDVDTSQTEKDFDEWLNQR